MRRNLFVVARGGGSEILRPRVQDGGERSGGVKFPNSSPFHLEVRRRGPGTSFLRRSCAVGAVGDVCRVRGIYQMMTVAV